MTYKRLQVLYWPRCVPFFYRPRRQDRDSPLYGHIYRFVLYVWPIEVRWFRR